MTITGSQAMNLPNPRWGGTHGSGADARSAGPRVTLRCSPPILDWGTALERVTWQLGVPIVSEEFTRRFGPRPALPTEISGTLPEILDRLCVAFGYQWRLKDGIYQFRSVTWFRDREEEPPGTLIKAALLARDEKRALTLEWLAAAFRAAQHRGPTLERLRVHAPTAIPILGRFQPVLAFYASLVPDQRQALETESGLTATSLSTRQRELLLRARVHLAPEFWPEGTDERD